VRGEEVLDGLGLGRGERGPRVGGEVEGGGVEAHARGEGGVQLGLVELTHAATGPAGQVAGTDEGHGAAGELRGQPHEQHLAEQLGAEPQDDLGTYGEGGERAILRDQALAHGLARRVRAAREVRGAQIVPGVVVDPSGSRAVAEHL
jgi:hypothetical protein